MHIQALFIFIDASQENIMKKYIINAGFSLLSLLALSSYAADVGVSVRVAEPGLYGRLDIGDLPAPRVIYKEPIVVERRTTRYVSDPVYIYAPPGHTKHWSKHCRRYNACNRPVYFVKEEWYRNIYERKHHPKHYEEWQRRRHGETREHHDVRTWNRHRRHEETREHHDVRNWDERRHENDNHDDKGHKGRHHGHHHH